MDNISRLLVQEYPTSSATQMCPDVTASCSRAVTSYTKAAPRQGRVWQQTLAPEVGNTKQGPLSSPLAAIPRSYFA